MKFNAIETDRTFKKQIIIENDKVQADLIGILHSLNSMELHGIKELIEFTYIGDHNEIKLEFERSKSATIKILNIKDKVATVKIVIFAIPLIDIYEKFAIKLNEKIPKDIFKESDFLIDVNTKSYIVIATGNNAEYALFSNEMKKIQNNIDKLQRDIKKNTENKSELEKEIQDLEQKKEDVQIDKIAFTLLSDKKCLAVEQINMGDNKIIYQATKAIEKVQKQMAGLRLIRLKEPFEFKNESVDANTKDLLENKELTSIYMDVWEKYAEKEGELLLQRAREIGEIEIKETDKFCLKIDQDLRKKLDEGDFICVMDTTPTYLLDKEIKFNDYMKWYITKEKLDTEKKYNTTRTYRIEQISSNSIVLEKQENMRLDDLNGKKFSLSIFGDFTALKRKYKARQRMLDYKSANPMLPMIFASEISESLQQMLKNQERVVYPPLSDNIQKKIFKTKPTDNQVEAIRMAINTKDIAIIQGPPGTGKTTVLNAIIERLNELNDKDLNKRGSIFIGGFQHSAVENLIQRMNLNGIPTPKFGKKSTEVEKLEDYDFIMQWSKKIADNIIIKEDSKLIKDFEELAKSYLKRPSQSKQIEILKTIINTNEVNLREYRDIARDMLDSLSLNKTIDDLSLIYAIRSNELSFNDDGLERNKDVLASRFENLLRDEEKELLRNKVFSKDLVLLRNNLIKRFSSRPKFEKEKPNSQVMDLIAKVMDAQKNLNTETKINVVLAEFKQKLQSNPFALKDMLKDYCMVFGATIGQSVGKDILEAKGIEECDTQQDETYSYDTVIIDEAAMVSPLDLFLVLVLAKHRIILVGDHRQLPHMLDNEVLKELENNTQSNIEIESGLLRESMFSFLKTRAQELEKIDGIKRFITLNNQFRTHPLLGNLVSDIFYKEHGEEYNSPRPESDFKHNLSGIENIPAVWINLPKEKGGESKVNTSRIRECEINTIADKLVEYLSSSAGEKLSYGVISFYRAQVEKIKDSISRLKQDPQYRTIKEALGKVKVGSVDQFQGNEFDVVFLSTVRSRKIKDDVSPQSIFGFLAVPNRLCVAMSRQKKCLIAVGDIKYFKTELAKQYVRGIYEFALLCETRGRVL